MDDAKRKAPNPDSDRSIAELTKQLTEQSTALAQKEVELAKAELAQKGKRLGAGIGSFGAAGLLAFFAFGALTTAAILGLATTLDGWLAALIVTAVYALVAGALSLAGKKQVEEATPPVPEQAIESTREDVEEIKQRVKEGRR